MNQSKYAFLYLRSFAARKIARFSSLSTVAILLSAPGYLMAASTSTALTADHASPINAYTTLTLTATVSTGTTPAPIPNSGIVSFYDTTTNPKLIGTAQIVTGTGTAILKVTPGVGNHNFRAQFQGVAHYKASALSTALPVTVNAAGTYTMLHNLLTPTGNATKGYKLVDQITMLGNVAPTGQLGFILDSSGLIAGPDTVGRGTGALYPVSATAPTNPLSSAVADLNGDGFPDVVYTRSAADGSHGNKIYITLNSGSNSQPAFGAATAIKVGTDPLAIVVGDFNADGHQDIAVANASDGTITMLLGAGDGTTFTSAGVTHVGTDPFSLAAGDFDMDGYLDLAVTNLGDNTVSILPGKGDGTFRTAKIQTLPTGSLPDAVAVADLNQDGYLDVIVANALDGTLTILPGNGDGTFQPALTETNAGANPVAIVVQDFDGDGYPDLAIANENEPAGSITVLEKLAQATGFQINAATTLTYTVGSDPIGLVAGDFTGRGRLDLVVANSGDNTVMTLPANTDGTFDPTNLQTMGDTGVFNGLSYISSADFNGDGKVDLIVPNYFGTTSNLILGARTVKITASGVTVPSGSHTIYAFYQSSGVNDPYGTSFSNVQTVTGPPAP